MRILALDLGKYKTVFLDSVVGSDKREYGKVDMTPQAIHDLLLERSPDRLVLDEPKRFENAKQVSAYAGLSPRQWQSGQSLREGHISHRGNPVLRALLVRLWAMLRDQAPWKEQALPREAALA